MDLKIQANKLSGKISIPKSKSMGHRAIICASLANGISHIRHLTYSNDIMATINAMKALGVKIEFYNEELVVRGIGNCIDVEKSVSIIKNCGKNKDIINIDVKESGSTIRFLLPLLSLFDNDFVINSQGKLLKRPLDPYFYIYDKLGIIYRIENNILFIENNKKFEDSIYKFDGNISSQFISGMMFLLPLLNFDSRIIIDGYLESKAYVDMTIDSLKTFGVEIVNIDYKEFIIRGNQKYKSQDIEVEGDFSQAAFFLVANSLQKINANSITDYIYVQGLKEDSNQADKDLIYLLNILDYINTSMTFDKKKFDDAMLKIFNEYMVKVYKGKSPIYIKENRLIIDGKDIPDIIPILSLYLSLSNFKSKIINIARLKIKESDRLQAIYSELKKLGVEIEYGEDFLSINPSQILEGNIEVDSYKDHRIAMMLAISSLFTSSPIKIKDAQCVNKSYPDFWKDFESLGGEIFECNMGK